LATKTQRLRCGKSEFVWGSRTYIMGILNATPDSFSGDGLAGDVQGAVERAKRMEAEGADIIDIGGESTRPGHALVEIQEELRRVIPVVEAVAATVTVPISIDTMKSDVAAAALRAGATMVNDVWGLTRDSRMAHVAAHAGAAVVVMHNQEGTRYQDLLGEIAAGLRKSIQIAVLAGIAEERIILDPGIGFGKTAEQNLEVLRQLEALQSLECPLLVGTSRKSTIGLVLGLPVEERLEGTAATVALAIAKGADIVRVHDVKEMTRVARMSDAIVRGWRAPA